MKTFNPVRLASLKEVKVFCHNHKIPSLSSGGCFVFAAALRALLRRGTLWCVVTTSNSNHTDSVDHVVLRLASKYADSKGIFTKKQLLDPYHKFGYKSRLEPLADTTEATLGDIWFEKTAVAELAGILRQADAV